MILRWTVDADDRTAAVNPLSRQTSAGRLPSGAVTFVLTDVEGSTRLWEYDQVLAAGAVARHREILDDVMASCGGVRPLEQGEGDSTVSAFNRPSDAVRAAHLAQRLLVEEPWKEGASIRVRMALHTGEVMVYDDGTYAGGALNRCARLRSVAHGGQVLVSSTTRDLVVDQLDGGLGLFDLGVHRLRDLSRPEHIWQLTGPGIGHDFPPLRSLDSVANNLPVQLSSFIGRDEDLARGVALLRETRLLTLTGAGGCGKTRLAQRIAAEEIDRYPAGVWWVELASLRDGSVIGDLVAAVMGEKIPADRPAVEVVAGLLGPGPSLLMLDNCEHLIHDAAAFVDKLLRINPSLAVVATSREPLSVEGEVTWRVPSLGLPPSSAAEPETLEQYDAVRLFIERALQARPNFRVTNQNAPAVAQICQRLDGIPLAIELAAARTSALSPERIAAELGDRFRLLIGHTRIGVPRQQTLYASVDWSHELLEPQERVLLRRLAVFVGGFTLDSAEAVVSFDPLPEFEVLQALTHLVDKSIVQPDDSTGGSGRYHLLETIRQYATDRLSDAGELSAVRDRHFEWAVDLALSLEPAVTNARPEALDTLEAEDANINAALDWAHTQGDVTAARRLIGALGLFWAQRGRYAEAAAWQARVLEDGPSADAGVARARWACAYVRFYAGDVVGAYEQASVALEEAREAGDESTTARCLHTLNTAMLGVDPAAARAGLLEAVDLARHAGDEWCLADALQIMAYTHLVEFDHRTAEEVLNESFPICDRNDNEFQRSWHHAGMAWAAMLRAEFDPALREIRRAMALARIVGDPALELRVCSILALILQEQGRPAELASELSVLRAERREWGSFGEALLVAFQAIAHMDEEPLTACGELEAVGSGFIDAGDSLDGAYVLTPAALAALEAGKPEDCSRLALKTEECAPGAFGSRARLLRGVAARLLGNEEASDLLHDSLSELSLHEVAVGVPLALENLGGLAARHGELLEAARLFGASEALRQRTSQWRHPGEQRRFDQDMASARESLGESFDVAWEEGMRLSAEEAVSYARRARGERKRPSSGWGSLTPTEFQVVELAAKGLTNPEIGERLFMGRGTVKTHLAHVFAKLGVATRAELAAMAIRQQAKG